MRKLFKEPLVHFLVLAIGLFGLHSVVSHDSEDADEKRIVVDRDNLLTFIQYRTKSFEPATAQKQLASLSDDALQKVIDDYVREEALYREAVSLGLDRDDYVIKRRLIQKIDYIARGFAESTGKVTDDDVRSYFEENMDDYYIEPRLTFTHVFISREGRSDQQLKELAENKLAELLANKVSFNDAPAHGERFLYGMNYVERSELFIESHFGTDMAEQLFSLEAGNDNWQGPLLSAHGAHLVMVRDKQEGRMPLLAEVRTRVTSEAQRALSIERTKLATQQIVDSYDVDIVYQQEKEKLAGLEK
jgi:hypothetical protein